MVARFAAQHKARAVRVGFLLGFFSLISAAPSAADIAVSDLIGDCDSCEPFVMDRVRFVKQEDYGDRPILVNVGSFHLEIPWNYFHPRPLKAEALCFPECDRVGIQFWVPTLEAPERDLWFRGEYSPVEPGKPHPSSNEFVFKVVSMRYVEADFAAEDTAELRTRETLRFYKRTAGYSLEPAAGGLTRLVKSKGDIGFVTFFAQTDDNFLLLKCGDVSVEGICRGYFDLKEYRFTGTALIPYRVMEHFTRSIDGVKSLLGKWQR